MSVSVSAYAGPTAVTSTYDFACMISVFRESSHMSCCESLFVRCTGTEGDFVHLDGQVGHGRVSWSQGSGHAKEDVHSERVEDMEDEAGVGPESSDA